MVIPSAPPNSPPLASDEVPDQYFSQNFPKAVVVPLHNFSFGTETPTVIGSQTSGAGAGKVKLNELTVEKNVDRLSPSLFLLSAQGAHFPSLQIFVRRAGGAAQQGRPYLAYEFSLVFITRLEWSGDGGGEAPVETVTFAYGALALGYYPQKPDGSLGTLTKLGWSQVTNTATGAETLSGF
jgi:type VI secretion system secreted protein Hcp